MKKTLTNSANITGLQNEDVFATLERILTRKGYLVTKQKKLTTKESPIFSSGEELSVDFYFEGKPAAPKGMAFSAKYQEVEGTADSKVYYEVDYVIKRCLKVPCVLLVRGDHWLGRTRVKARNWLKSEVDGKRLKEVFFSVDDLYKWASGLPDCTGFEYNGGFAKPLPLPLPDMEQAGLF